MKAICNKGICVFLFLSLLMSATMVNAQRVITASGKYITKNIKVTRFDQIYLKGSPTIEYTQSPGASKVQIAGSDNLVDLVECRVEGSTLIVNMKSRTNISYGKEGRLKILVSSRCDISTSNFQVTRSLKHRTDFASGNTCYFQVTGALQIQIHTFSTKLPLHVNVTRTFQQGRKITVASYIFRNNIT